MDWVDHHRTGAHIVLQYNIWRRCVIPIKALGNLSSLCGVGSTSSYVGTLKISCFRVVGVDMPQPLVPKFQRMRVCIGMRQQTRFGPIHHVGVLV